MKCLLTRLSITLFIFFLLTLHFANARVSDVKVQLLESSPERFLVKAQVESYSLSNSMDEIIIKGADYIDTPGEPQLPGKGFLLRIPAHSRFRVNVLEQRSEPAVGADIKLNPIPTYEHQSQPEKARVASTLSALEEKGRSVGYYPNELVELNYLGFMRDHYLLQVWVNLVQYDRGAKMARIYKRLVFELRQDKRSEQAQTSTTPGKFRNENSPIFDDTISTSILASSRSKVRMKYSPPASNIAAGQIDALDFYSKIANSEIRKIAINKDGLYRLTHRYLSTMGLNVSDSDPRNIRLYNLGHEISIYAHGESDGQFDNSDYIIFYGKSGKTIFSDNNVYWLVIGNEPGQRAGETDVTRSDDAIDMESYRANARLGKKLVYTSHMPERGDEDNWSWLKIDSSDEREFHFNLSHLATKDSTKARTKIALYAPVFVKHRIIVGLNGHELEEAVWYERGNRLLNIGFPQSLLNEGENRMTLRVLPTEFDYELFVDWFEVEYQRRFVAEAGILEFVPAVHTVKSVSISGFNNGNVELFEISRDGAARRMINAEIEPDSGGYTLKFQAQLDTSKKYVCLESSKFLTPASLVKEEKSSLRRTDNRSDYLIITHERFYNSVLPLAELHRRNGLQVEVVKTQDIYNEFNYGVLHPGAIRDFLKYTYDEWATPPPTYVLLVGDASYDYKNYLGRVDRNLVPTQMHRSVYFQGQSASDNWFVAVKGDDILPDMIIGRLPVSTVDEADAAVRKIHQYANDFTNHSWKNRALLVADNSEGGELFEVLSGQSAGISTA